MFNSRFRVLANRDDALFTPLSDTPDVANIQINTLNFQVNQFGVSLRLLVAPAPAPVKDEVASILPDGMRVKQVDPSIEDVFVDATSTGRRA